MKDSVAKIVSIFDAGKYSIRLTVEHGAMMMNCIISPSQASKLAEQLKIAANEFEEKGAH